METRGDKPFILPDSEDPRRGNFDNDAKPFAIPESGYEEATCSVDEDEPTSQMTPISTLSSSWLTKFFWMSLTTVVMCLALMAFLDFVEALNSRSTYMKATVWIFLSIFGLLLVGMVVREISALRKVHDLCRIRYSAIKALECDDLERVREAVDKLAQFYKFRQDISWGQERLAEKRVDIIDPRDLVCYAEKELLEPLDARAERAVEAAAWRVATVTAMVPLTLLDVIVVTATYLGLVRRISEIYSMRPGMLGSIHLFWTALVHLTAVGAISHGSEFIGTAAAGMLTSVGRRLGEGLLNGILTARMGAAVIEVCRPLPFVRKKPPSLTQRMTRLFTHGLRQSIDSFGNAVPQKRHPESAIEPAK
ncbi:MAG: TIGR01620 family protein [Rhodobacteraceae bacterium]|nr:TIGR01620 family protein [Paracoccaceae bacterium]